VKDLSDKVQRNVGFNRSIYARLKLDRVRKITHRGIVLGDIAEGENRVPLKRACSLLQYAE
jgi:hypothetical protein